MSADIATGGYSSYFWYRYKLCKQTLIRFVQIVHSSATTVNVCWTTRRRVMESTTVAILATISNLAVSTLCIRFVYSWVVQGAASFNFT